MKRKLAVIPVAVLAVIVVVFSMLRDRLRWD